MSEQLPKFALNDNPVHSLDEVIRHGVQRILAGALEREIQLLIARCAHLKDHKGHRLVVKNGVAKPRKIICGSGTVEVRAPRVHDRRKGHKFTSKILPPYLRKTPAVEAAISILYLKGISGNAFDDAMKVLLGDRASGFSKSSIAAMKHKWLAEMEEWKQRSIDEQFAYVWADGVNVNIRVGANKRLCLLVLVGVNATGEKKLLAVESGYRESSEQWRGIFRDLVTRGMQAPALLIGDGALGLWSALADIPEFAVTKQQRCWVHKTSNVLDKLPDNLHSLAKRHLHNMLNASHKKYAEAALRHFRQEFQRKYPKAVACLERDWEQMTAFYSFPGEHWRHLRTTNPIESLFASMKSRMRTTKGAGSERMAEAMAFKLFKEAEKKWNKICGCGEIKNLLSGRLYKDGVLHNTNINQQGVA